jgi:PAS domain S-box-containing protein
MSGYNSVSYKKFVALTFCLPAGFLVKIQFMNTLAETARLKALREYAIMDTEPEESYDELTRLAAQICGVPVATISLIDSNRQWYKSKVGMDMNETPRDISFCNQTIQQTELLVVPDATKDERFANNPYVVNNPNVRFYAGFPLLSREGYGIGSLCVVDVQPKELTEDQKKALEVLGRQAVSQLELRRRLREHKQALQALQASEERFRQFASHVDDLFWIMEAGQIKFVSQAFERIWGRSLADFYATPEIYLNAIHPDDRERVRAAYAQIPIGNLDESYRVLRPDGTIRWVRDRAFPHLDGDGTVNRVSGIASDITRQKETESERDRFFEASVDFMTVHKLGETEYRQVNSAWERTLGYTAEDFRHGSFLQFIHPDDVAPSMEVLAGLAQGIDVRQFRNRYRHKQDGSWHWLEWQAFAPEPGECLVYGTARDVTAQVFGEEQLRQKTNELERVFHVFPDQFFQLDQHSVIVDYRGGHAVGGGPFSGACIGLRFHDILSPDIADRFRKAKQAARRTQKLQQFEFIFSENGIEHSFEVRVLSDDGREVIVVIRDITDRALADRAQFEAKQAAESASRSKSEFLASMSHELRTPLNAILNISESLGEGVYGALNDKQQHSLQTVSESGRHLLGLINDILDLSKIEAGKLELQACELPVRHLCEASLRLVKEAALQRSQELSFEIGEGINLIQADERKLKQVLVNLLSNASKFTPRGGKFGLQVVTGGGEITFTVWDTGIGISPEDLKKLFQPFVQLDSKLSREYAGTGLGLSLAQRLAVLHRGRIDVESTPGLGSRFTVTLPASRGQGETVSIRPQTQRLPAVARSKGPGPSILLVEDIEANRECIGDYLESKGFTLQFAVNGLEALERVDLWRPDIVISDIQMSGMDGFEAIRRLRAKLPGTPIVALTALAMEGDSDRCLAAGATHYLSKPVELKKLASTLLSIADEARKVAA